MKKIIGIVLNIISVILAGITFGLGSLPMSYAYEKIAADQAGTTQMGNFYEMVWVKGHLSPLSLVLFFVLCAGALVVTITLFMNTKKWAVCNVLSGILLLGAGVMMFFLPKFYLSGFQNVPANFKYVLGEGAISMAVLLLIAGVFQVLKTALTAKEE